MKLAKGVAPKYGFWIGDNCKVVKYLEVPKKVEQKRVTDGFQRSFSHVNEITLFFGPPCICQATQDLKTGFCLFSFIKDYLNITSHEIGFKGK